MCEEYAFQTMERRVGRLQALCSALASIEDKQLPACDYGGAGLSPIWLELRRTCATKYDFKQVRRYLLGPNSLTNLALYLTGNDR